jgi:hypothetical protein
MNGYIPRLRTAQELLEDKFSIEIFKDKKKIELTIVLFTGIIRTRFFFLLITS